MTLELKPLTLAEANAFIRAHHSHHPPVVGHKFSIGCTDNGRLCGVVVVGRPVSRVLQGEGALEVTRSCTDGTKHAASKLIAAAWRTASAMGCRRLVSYTLASESGLSYRAAGWARVEVDGVPVEFGGGHVAPRVTAANRASRGRARTPTEGTRGTEA